MIDDALIGRVGVQVRGPCNGRMKMGSLRRFGCGVCCARFLLIQPANFRNCYAMRSSRSRHTTISLHG
jgi:hypothetical protein